MILGAVDSDGNLIIKSSHTFGYDWFAGGSGGTAQDRYVSSQGTGESKSHPPLLAALAARGVM